MAFTQGGGPPLSGEAGSAITRFRFVTSAADGQYDHAGSAQGSVQGISSDNQTVVGKAFPFVPPDGRHTKVELGGTVAAGGLVATDTVGRAIAQGASNGDLAWGTAIEGGVIGDVVTIQFMFSGQVNA